MEIEKRVGLIEQAILQMKDILVSHSDRLDDYYSAMKRSREDFEFKMNALIDAQIKNESEIAELRESVTELRVASTELRQASESQLARIGKLEQN